MSLRVNQAIVAAVILFTKGAGGQRLGGPQGWRSILSLSSEVRGFAPAQVSDDQEHFVTDDCSVWGANCCPSVPSE